MNTEGMNLTIMLISIVAPIGAFDVIYFHIYRFRLARRPESWAETTTHIVRSLSLGVLITAVTWWEPAGLWFWAIGGLFAVDFVNSAVDAFLERDSRASLGGLPRSEYIIHIIGATFMGAIAISFFIRGWHLGGHETALLPRAELPALMRLDAIGIAIGSFALAGYEAAVMATSARRQPAPQAP